MSTLGLVLSGGGARGAYQAGVLSAMADISVELGIEHPFKIYTGVSAGAINTGLLTAHPGNFSEAAKELVKLWQNIKSDDVFISNPLSLTKEGLHWLFDLSFGGIKKATTGKSLLDTTPLRRLIADNCDFTNVQKKIDAGHIDGVGISSLDYFSTSTVTFVQAKSDIPDWQRIRRQSEKVNLTPDHILASSAIPLLFPPVTIGDRHFGDGCVRNQAPCGPAIFMGAEKLIAIGVRPKQDKSFTPRKSEDVSTPSVARVVNVLLSAVMLDGIELDIERIERMNSNIAKIPAADLKDLSLRSIDYLWLCPSREPSEIASKKIADLPAMIRYLLRGLGSLKDASEIASYLLFETSYCEELIEIGYEDGMREKETIRKAFIQTQTR